MATVKQLQLRIKYAKTTLNSLIKKLNGAKARAAKLEAELKKAKTADKKKGAKKPAKKAATVKKVAGSKERR